jgi:hypothetical protein
VWGWHGAGGTSCAWRGSSGPPTRLRTNTPSRTLGRTAGSIGLAGSTPSTPSARSASSLEVDHCAAGVRATARENLLLLLIDVPVPHLEEFARYRDIDVWEQSSEAASDPAGLIDRGPENVEDDHVDVGV